MLDSLETVFRLAQNMTYNGVHPVVEIVKKTYHTGVKLTHKAMEELEKNDLNDCPVWKSGLFLSAPSPLDFWDHYFSGTPLLSWAWVVVKSSFFRPGLSKRR